MLIVCWVMTSRRDMSLWCRETLSTRWGFLRHRQRKASAFFVVNLELGRALSLAGRMDEAREALKLAPSVPLRSDVEVSILLSAREHRPRTIRRGTRASRGRLPVTRANDPDPDITFLLGRSLAGANKSDAALEKFRETVKKEPRFHEAYFEAADVLRRRGDSEAAFELLNRACHLAPDEIRYNRELAELVLSDGGVGDDEEAGLAACDRLMVQRRRQRLAVLEMDCRALHPARLHPRSPRPAPKSAEPRPARPRHRKNGDRTPL